MTAPKPLAKAAPVAATPVPTPDAPISVPVSQRLIDWSTAWSKKDVTTYLSFYDSSFKPSTTTRAKWFANRTKLVRRDGPIDLKLSNVQRKTLSPTLVETTFEQSYTSKSFKDTTKKSLIWKRVGTNWYIVKESSR
jgi:adhesin transport system outer membrane protein